MDCTWGWEESLHEFDKKIKFNVNGIKIGSK